MDIIQANKDQITIKVMQSKFQIVSQNDVELFCEKIRLTTETAAAWLQSPVPIIDAINEKKNNNSTLYQNWTVSMFSGNENKRALLRLFPQRTFDPDVEFICIDYVKIDKMH